MAIRGTLASLDKIKAKAAEKTGFADGEKAFLQLKDGESAVIRFLQELSADSPFYDDRRGTLVVVEEHVSPKDFKLRAVCTLNEEGRCWACEQMGLPEIGKKWKARMRFYSNVLVRMEDGDKVKVLASGFGDKNVGKVIIDYAEEYDGLGGQDFKLSRSGAGMNDTSYRLIPKAPKPLTDDEQKLELIDLEKFIKYVEYDNQSEFYAGNTSEEKDDKDW